MDKNKTFDLKAIALECQVKEDIQAEIIVKNLEAIKDSYDEENLVLLYNYSLTVCKKQEVLMYLVREIDRYREHSSLSFVLDLLLDRQNPINLRIMCAKVASHFKDTSAVTPILYCLNNKDENYKLRLACADSLGRIGDKYAVAPLIDLIQDEDEKSVYVRESAVAALGALGDSRAIDPLVSILETKKGFMDKFTFLKERVIEALGKINFTNRRVMTALKHSLTDDSTYVRINAIEALMNSGEEEAVELIRERLKDSDEEVRKNALVALYNMIGRQILDEVLDKSDYDDFLKKEAMSLIDEYEEENNE
ncbi:HEAT repeat domain-containing protein [bacterium]|nr:HEAT repeat domain-containing protein [bacterium]